MPDTKPEVVQISATEFDVAKRKNDQTVFMSEAIAGKRNGRRFYRYTGRMVKA